MPLEDAERNTRAVFDVLARAVNAGEMADIADELGDEYDAWLGRERRPRPARPAQDAAVPRSPASPEPELATVSPIVEPFVAPTPDATGGVTTIPRARVHSPVGELVTGVVHRTLSVVTWPLRAGFRSLGRVIPVAR